MSCNQMFFCLLVIDFVHTVERNACEGRLVGVKELPAAEGSMAGDVFHPTAIRDQALLLQHVVKVHSVELGEAVLLGNVDLECNRHWY